jgi:ABC-type branched-subunit amino acid transport system substrate-binding protein
LSAFFRWRCAGPVAAPQGLSQRLCEDGNAGHNACGTKTAFGGEMKRSIATLVLATGLATGLMFAGGALAQSKLDKVVKVGSLGDQSGLYQDIGGPGSSVAAQMAIEDSGLLAKGWKIDLISADHQNKPDVGANIAKQWIDVEKVDVFVDLASSGVGLAVANVAKERNVVNLNSGSASSDLTGLQCSPRQSAGQIGRRYLVLPDRGLCLRPGT